MIFMNKRDAQIHVGATKTMELLSRYAGVGLWDAALHNGDPMHHLSKWTWSEEFRRLLGFSQGDLSGFPDVVGSWADRLHPADAGPTFEKFGACLADRSGKTGYDVTYRLKTRDGTFKWFRAIGGVSRNAEGLAVKACGALIDVDEQKSEEERTKLLGQYAGVGLWDAILFQGDPMHAKSKWTWSDEFRRLLGYTHGDYTGFPDLVHSWSDRLHPDDAMPTFQKFGACLADRSGKTGYDVTYRLRMRDGSYRWFRAIGGAARDATGAPIRACGTLLDVHDQKLSEFEQSGSAAARRAEILRLAESLETSVGSIAERTRSSAQNLAVAAKQLSGSITEINKRVATAAGYSAQAFDETSQANETIQSLGAATNRIGAVVELISAIASQTNLWH